VKKRLALISAALGMALTMLLPSASFAATGYTFTIVDQKCESGGHGHNPYFRVKLTAAGTTSANKLTIKSVSQYFSGGTWHTSYHWATNKSKFTPDGTAHSIDYSYNHYDAADTRQWRIKSTLKALQGKHVLASKTLTSKAC
jgi:hypothetical protein